MAVITVQCKSCSNTMRFGTDKAGRRAKCPKCGTVNAIPSEDGIASGPPPIPEAAPPELPNNAYAPPSADDVGEYGVATQEAPPQDDEAEDGKKKDKKKKHKVQRKVKPLENIEEWEKVRLGLMMIFAGVCLWGAAHILHGSFVLMGVVDYPEYSRLVMEELREHPNPPEDLRDFRDVDQLSIFLGMISGTGFRGYAKVAIILSTILTFFQLICWGVGYGLCWPVPERFGTTLQVRILLGLVAFNVLALIFIQLLPLVGAYQYFLIPVVVPEIVMTDYNIERSMPIHAIWSTSLFWEMQLAMVLQFVAALEPIVGGAFIWAIGLWIREDRIINSGQSLTQLGIGTFYILLSFHIISTCGTSSVLVTVLRVLYCLWFGAQFLLILRYGSALLKTREMLAAKLNPENPAA